MNHYKILNALFTEDWFITPQAFASVIHLVTKLQPPANVGDAEMKRVATDWYSGREIEIPQMVKENGIATIPILGTLAMGVSKYDKAYGFVDVQDVFDELDDCVADASIKSIILRINSPGGTSTGIPELADYVGQIQKANQKKIVCYVEGSMASAAYYIGAGASAIYGAKSSKVGSIGTYMTVMDASKYFEDMGIKFEIIKAGKLKAAGSPYKPLSDEEKSYLQGLVNEINQMFLSHVSTYRKRLKDEHMQGQMFLAAKAAEIGMIDGIVGSIKDVKARLS